MAKKWAIINTRTREILGQVEDETQEGAIAQGRKLSQEAVTASLRKEPIPQGLLLSPEEVLQALKDSVRSQGFTDEHHEMKLLVNAGEVTFLAKLRTQPSKP